MKRPAGLDQPRRSSNKRSRRNRGGDQMTEMLKLCLEKVCELQADLERSGSEDELSDAEAAGYAACALETIRFLSEQGLSADHPMVRTLTEKLAQHGRRRP